MSEEKKKFISYWADNIKAGKAFRDKYSTYHNWKDYRNMYRNKWAKNILPINKVFSYGRMMIPRVYFNAPRVSVTATKPELVGHARAVEEIDNNLIRETGLKRTLKKSILDAFLCGIGPIKLGFDSEFGYITDQAQEDGETLTQVSKDDGEKIEYYETIKPGAPWAMRCRPEDIIMPWGSDDVKNLPWIAHRIIRPLDDVKQDQKYDQTAVKELKGTRVRSDEAGKRNYEPLEQRDKEHMYAELWEVRDAKTKRMYVFCEEKLLLDVEDPLQIEGLPYEFIDFNPDPDYVWSIPDVDVLQAQQKELNEISTQTQRHRAIALLKFLYDKDKMTQEDLEQFLSSEVGPAVGVNADGNIAGAILPWQPHIPPDLQNAAIGVVGAMKESLGFSSNEMGEYNQGSPRSATETMTVAGSFEQRISERKDIVADALTNILRKWNQMIFKFWTTERVIRIVGPEGAVSWPTYTGDQLEGEYFLNVDADSGMPLSRGLKHQMAQDMLMKFGGDPMINQVLLRQIVLESYSNVDPRAVQLLAVMPGMDPSMLGAARQPSPMGAAAGAGKGAGGGRSGSSPEKPQEFSSFKNRHGLDNK